MERIKIDLNAPGGEALTHAAQLLDKGRVIIFPTETLYGLLARLDRPKALARINKLKSRESKKAMPCLAADARMARAAFDPPPASFEPLAKRLWPGPLTLVGRARSDYIGEATGWGPTIGVRVPGAKTSRRLVEMVGVPLVATSANPARMPASFCADDVASYFCDEPDLVLFDAGPLAPSRGSTVIDISTDPPLLLRSGDAPPEKIEEVLGRPLVEIIVGHDENLQDLMHGPLRIIQKLTGFRYSIDPLLLAAFVEFDPGDRIIDLGSGSGVIPLILAGQGAHDVAGIEYQRDLADMSRRSILANALEDRARIVYEDVCRAGDVFEKGSFDIAVSNPPYFPVGTGHISPDETRAASRHEVGLTLGELIDGMKYLVREGGKIYLIHLASRQEELTTLLREAEIGACKIRRVLPKEKVEAKFLLVSGIVGSPGKTTHLPPLVVHQNDGDYTPEAKSMLIWQGKGEG
jgi:tRNA threonylcarbamoyl adenosine modification protein (Sua5/YciO/YrdC/YwlC family)